MARVGKRYPLLIYTRMMDRWWPALFLLGLALLALAWHFYTDLYDRIAESWHWMTLAGLGAVVLAVSLMMLLMRKGAYVQPFNDHLRLVTPFLRMNISYRRVRRTTTANVSALFPPKSMSGLKREIIEPLSSMTAVIVDLNAYPIPPATLRLFLSPFFFKDRTPHLVLLVQNWMGFSTELESMRVSPTEPRENSPTSQSLLLRLPKK
jgi:hypothetical protein